MGKNPNIPPKNQKMKNQKKKKKKKQKKRRLASLYKSSKQTE